MGDGVLRSIVGGDWVVASAFKTLQNYLKILSVLVPPHIDGCNLLRATYAALECTYNELRISPQFVDEQYFCHRELDCRSCLDCYAGDSNDPFEELAKTVLDDSAEDMLDAVTPESPASKASTEGAFRTQGQS